MKKDYLVSNTVTAQFAEEAGGLIAVRRIRSRYKMKSK